MRKTTTITVTVEIDGTEYVHQLEGTHWTRGNAVEDNSVYVYDANRDIDGPVLEVNAENFVEAFREDDVDTIGTITT